MVYKKASRVSSDSSDSSTESQKGSDGLMKGLKVIITNLTDDNNEGVDKSTAAPLKSADIIQNSMGEFGRWHVLVCAAIFLVKFPVAWHLRIVTFMAPTIGTFCSDRNFKQICSPKCTDDFSKEDFTETVKTEFDLIRDRRVLLENALPIFNYGYIIGYILFGLWADKYGRKTPLIMAGLVQLASGVGTAFVPSFSLFRVLRFINAVAIGGLMVVSFVLLIEIISAKYRELISMSYQICSNLGRIILTILSYYIRHWRHLQFAISIFSVLMLLYYWLIPESPRWLFIKGRLKESAAVLEKAAKMNKLPTHIIRIDLENFARKLGHTSKTANGNVFDLLRTPNLRLKTLCLWFNWFVCGLTINRVDRITLRTDTDYQYKDIFWFTAVHAAFELPGTLLCIYTTRAWDRKCTLIVSNTLIGVCLLLLAYDFNPTRIIMQKQLSLETIAMIGVNISIPAVYLFSGELFPTVVRGAGIGIALMIYQIGPILVPFIHDYKIYDIDIPPKLLGVIPLLGALCVLVLPETRGQTLPASIEDAELFGQKSFQRSKNHRLHAASRTVKLID